MMPDRIYAIIPAAGSGSRMQSDIPKQLMSYRGSTVLGTVLRRFALHDRIDRVILVSPADGALDEIYARIAESTAGGAGAAPVTIVRGGDDRGSSVRAGLREAESDAARSHTDPGKAIVLIHDAARPGVTEEIITENIESVKKCRAVVTAVPAVDSIRILQSGPAAGYDGYARCSDPARNTADGDRTSHIDSLALKESEIYPIMNSNVADRRLIYCVQTPQTFILQDIIEAYDKAERDGYTGTDDASIAEYAGIRPAIIRGAASNRKITFQEDLTMNTKVGMGYDVHKLVPGRPLILCGTPVPYEKGLLGHSDADVATHALMDALLGAAGLGDIGQHFPDNDERYRGADSLELLGEVRRMLGDVTINNADITIIAQAPGLAAYKPQMKTNIAKVLGIPEASVNIKATTEEGLGFTGSGEGIAAAAVCTIEGRTL